jgi:hypothetical protein
MRWMSILVFVLAAACGKGPAAPAAIEGRGGTPALAGDEVATLEALAEAARRDDGAALDALIHPTHGLWIWTQPGVAVTPTLRLEVGRGEPPSARLAAADLNDYWREELWHQVAGPLERGLGAMDRDPADRHAAVYGTCDELAAGALRAWLVTEDLGPHYGELLAEAHLRLPPVMTTALAHFRSWGLDVWLMRDQGRWWVAHVMVWTPCDA